ncbi:deoxycytidylate deaminase [Acetoanaerobium pronyense]|uniref:Deoxycytidylate deaminase n=1 Tax=Acetoanaerobium pronyense TaxID=1482736 RepID=A0ABS4KLG3_9FIRM|nr:anti-phage dCTP deaminase [Acetoanaerobium pronyense]MBP2028613.1 deoxycytidylate deaminase [Acetoanaerobium pronyense]
MSKESIKSAIEKLFSERKEFIIIGLTGRTGSGCTTVANLFSQSFKELSPPPPKESDDINNEERKYKIVYDYASENWKSFIKIEGRDIITSFLLEHNFDKFTEHLKNKLHINDDFNEIKETYNEMHIKRIKIMNILNENESNLGKEEVYNFYFKEVKEFTKKIAKYFSVNKTINDQDVNLFTFLFQQFGTNIRSSGNPFLETFDSEKTLLMAQRFNTLIKILRKRNLESKKGVLVVIDAIRNPFEATFFKDRYSSFYLFSVNTEDDVRIKRLFENKFSKNEIENLDKQEYPKKQSQEEFFKNQNIQKCIELSDVYLYNNSKFQNFNNIKKDIIRYVSLIMHPGIITPTSIERCMQIAYNSKVNSGCISRQVGAVITDEFYSIKAVGWNSSPEGQVPCNLRNIENLKKKIDENAFSHFEMTDSEFNKHIKDNYKSTDLKTLKGNTYTYCFKDIYNSIKNKENQVHTRALHAEENAFLQISKYGGIGVKGGFLFTTASPCELCSKKAYQLGIKKIYYIDPYPGISTTHILDCGKSKPEMNLFVGAIGRAYTQFFTQILPIKDELKMRTLE